MRTSLFCGALALLFISCKHAPDMPRCCVERPPRRTAAHADSGEPRDRWWQTFGSSQLNEAVEEALVQNPDLIVAAGRLDAALAEARIAGADLKPRLGAGFDAARTQRNFIGFPIPGGQEQVLTTRSTTFGLNLNTSWELDLWGRIRAARQGAKAEARASEADLAGARLSLAAQTAKAWFAATEARRQVEIAEATVNSFCLTTQQVRDRYERGLRPSLDLRLAEANFAAAESLLSERRNFSERATRQLELLLGRYPSGKIKTSATLQEVPEPVPAGLPAELVARRPDLAAAEQRVFAADARVAQARATLYPRISLTGSGGTSSSELEDLLSSQFKVWTIAGNLAQPLFEGGRLRANVDLSQARMRQALAAFQGEALRAFGEVENALAAEQWLGRREEELKRAFEQASAAKALAEDRYRRGLEIFATVLDAQRRALESETQLTTVRRLRLENRVDLHLALGGGFSGETLANEPKQGQTRKKRS